MVLFSCIFIYPTLQYDVKIGLLMPHDEVGFVKYMYGFSTTAGAVPMALDRVKQEQLLPDANIRSKFFPICLNFELITLFVTVCCFFSAYFQL